MAMRNMYAGGPLIIVPKIANLKTANPKITKP